MYFSEWVLYVVEFAEASTNQNPINNKAFLKFQRHNCSMKSISFGFYAQLSVVCMWLSQYIDIYTIYIYILYTSIKCVSLVDPSTSRPQGFGLWDGTERKKQKKKQDGRSGRPGTRSPTRRQPKSDVWHYRYEALEAPMPFPAVQHPFAVWVLLKVEVPWLFLTWCPTVDGRNPPSQLIFTIMFHVSAC